MQGLKMLVIIYSGPEPERVTAVLDAHPVGGYTEFGEVRGVGSTGRRGGSRAWPGRNLLFMSVMDENCARTVVAALRKTAQALPEGQRLHVVVLPVEAFG
jgi:hypothetical protein